MSSAPPSSTSPLSSPRKLVVLGATGSIGVSTLRVADHLNREERMDVRVVGLAAGSNAQLLLEQARTHRVPTLAIADGARAAAVCDALPETCVYSGDCSASELVEHSDADLLVGAIVGVAGLPATLAGIRKGMDIALANKETLVAAGELVVPLAREHHARLLPVDSEHSAIFQCLRGHESPDTAKPVHRIVLTASGGPFRQASKQQIEKATPEQALNHPTWNMGPKVTIDSATMMNKALEIIEAHWLFGLDPDRIDVMIHPQSIVHGLVEFADHSILAQLGAPDMRTPIQYALTYPERPPGCSEPLDMTRLSRLDFEQPDSDRFPALDLARRVIDLGGTAGAVFNAANEAAVAAFLDHRLPFGKIVPLVEAALDAIRPVPVTDLNTILEADAQARTCVRERINR